MAGPWLRVLEALGVLLLLLLLVPASPATVASVLDQPTALQGWKPSPSKKLCSPGFHWSRESGDCKPCLEGVDYTSYANGLPACVRCAVCKRDKEETSPCTTTRDTECSCKSGTFWDKGSPEICQKCTKCTSEEVEERPCTPRADRRCVRKDSGSPHLTDILVIVFAVIGTVALTVIVAVRVWKAQGCNNISRHMKSMCPGRRPACESVNTVSWDPLDPEAWSSAPHHNTVALPRGPEVQEDNHSEITRGSESWSTLAYEEETDRQEPVTSVAQQVPEETERLLGPAKAEGSPMRRKLLLPADGNDPIETLSWSFSYCQHIVPFPCWDNLMRQMGLTANEIHVVRARTQDPGDVLYEMLRKWLNKTGRAASINTLLDALEALGERYAREEIEAHLVTSKKFVYQEGWPDSAGSLE